MLKRLVFFFLVTAVALFGGVLPQQARGAEVSFSFFYDHLSPYGSWIDVEGYGTCWQPDAMPYDWAPYTDGSWAYTNVGWTWVSNEDFGEIVYHYGRWARLEGLGWVWQPDSEWGPGWVSWRSGGDYIGWAPLPPEVRFSAGVHIGGWVDESPWLGPLAYAFCRVQDFGAPSLRGLLFARERNVTIIRSTVNITNISYNRSTKIVVNGGPDYRSVSQRSRHSINRLKLERRSAPGDYRRGSRAHRSGGALVVHAPRVKRDHGPGPKISRKWEGNRRPGATATGKGGFSGNNGKGNSSAVHRSRSSYGSSKGGHDAKRVEQRPGRVEPSRRRASGASSRPIVPASPGRAPGNRGEHRFSSTPVEMKKRSEKGGKSSGRKNKERARKESSSTPASPKNDPKRQQRHTSSARNTRPAPEKRSSQKRQQEKRSQERKEPNRPKERKKEGKAKGARDNGRNKKEDNNRRDRGRK